MPEFGEHNKDRKKWRIGIGVTLAAIVAGVLGTSRDPGTALLVMFVTVPIAGLRMYGRLRANERQDEAIERLRVERYRWFLEALFSAKEQVVWLYREPKNDGVLVANLANGMSFPLRDRDPVALLAAFTTELPHAVVGYTPARAVLFKKKPASFLASKSTGGAYRESARPGHGPDVDTEAERVYLWVRTRRTIALTIAAVVTIAIAQSIAEARACAAIAQDVATTIQSRSERAEAIAARLQFVWPEAGSGFESCRYPDRSFVSYARPSQAATIGYPGWAWTGEGGTLSRFLMAPMSLYGRSVQRKYFSVLQSVDPGLVVLRIASTHEAGHGPDATGSSFELMVNVVDIKTGLTTCAAHGTFPGTPSEFVPLIGNIERGIPEWWKHL